MEAELTEAEARGLDQIKAKMSQTQRSEMAEVIRKEMERRGMLAETGNQKSGVRAAGINGGLSSDQVKELYQDVGQAMQQLKVKKLEEKLSKARGNISSPAPKKRAATSEEGMDSGRSFSATRISLPKKPGLQSFLFFAVCSLAAAKAAFSFGLFETSIATAKPITKEEIQAPIQVAKADYEEPLQIVNQGSSNHLWSQQEKDILTQLDSRRVELEKRKDALDKREIELKNQTQALTERLAELRGLTAKLQELRKEREHKQEGRMAQLANVYGGMEPAEAANLLSRLEDPISLELLERMPEKRMGQVLSYMEKGRAVDLTKLLTEKKVVE
jgi:flagellar motility protein MotE (MotC chaperone)